MLRRASASMGRRPMTTVNSNYVKRLVQDANNHPMDPLRQLRVLQMLNKIHPSLVIQRVEEVQFAMSQEVQKEYMKALVNSDRMDSVDLNLFLARMQTTGIAGLTTRETYKSRGIPHDQTVNEYGYRAWAAFAMLAWGGIVGMSLMTFWNEEGWKEEHPMTAGFMRGLELHSELPKRSSRPSSQEKTESTSKTPRA
ncbi:hypothetical protein H310_04591 [Aphanomyces invadans]|uniref:Uncharacterized protein n=1 Tax=Aphanomyces invadans TaxID=157072 RepID=A0A024UCX2_9STRA|nr:hypothetical protein H310_04591 [Aphanomyces invadans]ETW04266.1 hypothetical protein H310_04591 [Aphanomyces invadans]RHY35532.1 hypothetical protein DYB32_000003 [Aphanomyces invadans]|eukprot:XP_008867222.1 hypothetical protein H310_04591 [Aphanomyces invadans]